MKVDGCMMEALDMSVQLAVVAMRREMSLRKRAGNERELSAERERDRQSPEIEQH
jgi:hypothetical protein